MREIRRVSSVEDHFSSAEVELLLNHPCIDVNSRNAMGLTALHSAIIYWTKSAAGVQLLLSNERCDVNVQDENSYTALMYAVTFVQHLSDKYARIIELMLKHPSIDVNRANRDQQTALHLAGTVGA